jgi:nitrite reductase/ring-hydroxylating ferredoxin subunit
MTDLIFPGLTDIVMPMKEPLCHINEIADPGAKGFELAHNDKTLAFFVVKKHGQIFGYLNKYQSGMATG